jgi:hypothetical protein
MISGYSTFRLYAPALASSAPPTSGYCGVSATIENLEDTPVQMSFVPLNDRTDPVLAGSGTRCTLYDAVGGSDDLNGAIASINSGTGSTLSVSGYGSVRVTFQTQRSYLEVFTDGLGPTNIRVTLESLLQWDQMSFDKTETKYPVTTIVQPPWSSFPWPT